MKPKLGFWLKNFDCINLYAQCSNKNSSSIGNLFFIILHIWFEIYVFGLNLFRQLWLEILECLHTPLFSLHKAVMILTQASVVLTYLIY